MKISTNILKFTALSFAALVLVTVLPEIAQAGWNAGNFKNFLSHHGGVNSAPEFALNAAAASGAILSGGIAVLFGRKKKQ